MSTQNTSGIESNDRVCARDFVLSRLEDADESMSPAELAGEYGCSNGHVRNVLRDLLRENEVGRVDRGEYVAPPPEGTNSDVDLSPKETPGLRGSDPPDEDLEGEDLQADLDAPGEDPRPDDVSEASGSEGNGQPEDGRARPGDIDGTAGGQETTDDGGQEIGLREQFEELADHVDGHGDRVDDLDQRVTRLEESMPTDLEYSQFQEQHDQDDSNDDGLDHGDGGTDGYPGSGAGLPIGTVALIAGLLGVAYLSYQFVAVDASDGDSTDESTESESSVPTLIEGGV